MRARSAYERANRYTTSVRIRYSSVPQKCLRDVFSGLPENAVRSIYAVAIGDENRFGELVATFWR